FEVGAERDGPAIDARLDLAAEERLSGVLPMAMVPDLRHRLAHSVGARVDPEVMEQVECWQRRDPRLAVFHVGPLEARREARAARPLPVFTLQRQEARTPT